MSNPIFMELMTLLVISVVAVVVFQRLRMPSSLGYLLVGAIVGPHALGLVPDAEHNRVFAEFGIVFLLFTIGLNFSLPQILAMRHLVFSQGTAQVVLTTAVVGLIAWLLGLSPAAAFVVGAVFAQSSTTIISKQLTEQGEDQSRHGRLGVAMSVFQDVTAVPFVVVIPVLGAAATGAVAGLLGIALLKAAAAFVLVYLSGRWLLRPLFHEVAARRSPELFTLTVLLVILLAAGATDALGLSMALGAFLAGMMLGDTEFRHQIESTIRPFRDVLLGLFFITIGMLLDVSALPAIWHWAVLGAAGLLLVKTLLVAFIIRTAGIDLGTAVRTGIVLAVGGEFGLALLAIALGSAVISPEHAQIVLMAVLFSMIGAPFLIRYNGWIASRIVKRPVASVEGVSKASDAPSGQRGHVIVCGYGRIGQNVGHFLEAEGVPFVALDLDSSLVREAHAAGMPVYYGDASERDMLETLGIAHTRLLVVSYNDLGSARKVLHHARSLRPDLKIMVRTRDEAPVDELLGLGATEVVAETLEASIMIASHALLLADVPAARVMRRMRDAQANRYQILREIYRTDDPVMGRTNESPAQHRLDSVVLTEACAAIGRRLADLHLPGCRLHALTRADVRETSPSPETVLRSNDILVLFGTPENLEKCVAFLLSERTQDAEST